MKGADRRVAAALDGVVEIHPHQLFVFAELPDEPSTRFCEGLEPFLAKLRPRYNSGFRQGRSDVRCGGSNDVARMAVGSEAGNIDPRAVFFIGSEEGNGNRIALCDLLGA